MSFKLSRVRATNVLTWKNLDLIVPQNQVLGIHGGNYSGKSNLVDIIFLALFNKTLRSHSKASIVSDGEKDWKAEVSFSLGSKKCVVSRGSRECSFSQEGFADRIVGAAAVNEKMAEILKCSLKQFMNISYLGQNRGDSLASCTSSDRRKVISPFIDLPDFKTLNEKVRKQTKGSERELTIYEERVGSLTMRIQQSQSSDDAKLLALKKSQADTKESMVPSQTKFRGLSDNIKKVESLESDLEAKSQELALKAQAIKSKCERFSTLLGTLKKSEPSRCTSCFSLPTQESRDEAVVFTEQELAASQARMDLCKAKAGKLATRLKDVRVARSRLIEARTNVGKIFHGKMNDLKVLKGQIELLGLEEPTKPLHRLLNAAQKGLAMATQDLDHMSFWSKALGSNGLPSYMLGGILDDLSERVTVYLNDILPGVTCRYQYDKDIKCTIINKGFPRDFEACSGAERRLIDLASSFALRDIALERNGEVPGFVLLDEIFDSLDDDHLQVVQLWLSKLKGCTALLITHNSGLKDWIPDVREVRHDPVKGSFFL